MKVLFYLDEKKLSPRGGPYGVGYYYWEEMNRRGDAIIDFISEKGINEDIISKGRTIAAHLPKSLYKLQHELRDIKRLKSIFANPMPAKKIDLAQYDVVQFHETLDLYMEKKQLEDYKGIVVLQSHSPLPLGMEKCLDYPPIYRKLIPDIAGQFNEVDRYAFERADYLLFPCEEAEESYLDNWESYADIKRKKKDAYKYVLTGINPAKAKRSRDEVREELGIPNGAFVVCYAGRHNEVKGYPSLKRIGLKFIDRASNHWIVVAGRLGPIEAPINPRWKEIGWTTDAHSYIGAADVFVLPNKVTYFDLVMLEVLSLGKIVVASRTGGNKYFENKAPGVFLYDTEDEALGLLEEIKQMSPEERMRLVKENIMFYEKNLSAGAMYDSYMRMLKEIERI